jgi:L-arabinose isomerase
VDSTDKAFATGLEFKTRDVDLIFIYITTYALSATVLPVVQKAKVPVIILNLSPGEAIDYEAFNSMTDRMAMTGEWLANCTACPVPELCNVFNRVGIPYQQVTGMLNNDPECWDEIAGWMEAAGVARTMAGNRLGCMGHYYNGMLDIYTDLTRQLAVFGGHIEILEIDELSALRKSVREAEAKQRVDLFNRVFDIQPGCSADDLKQSAITSLALDEMVKRYRLGSLAYYYKGNEKSENQETVSSIILGASLLTANAVPVAGEYEIKNAQAMKIMDSFGAGGSFTEYYAMDFQDDTVLMGHDGPAHMAIAEGRIKVRPLKAFHGKEGSGVSVEMTVKNGPVTLLSVVERKNGGLLLLIAEAMSVPGPILQIGNTNSRYRFPIGARRFVTEWNQHGPAHHCAVGTGHISTKIKKLGWLLNMEVIQVC